MRALNTQISRWLLGGSIYLTGWYYEGPALQASQMGAISLLLMAGFFAALSGDTRRIRPSLTEWMFGFAFLFAMLVAWMTDNWLSTMYGAMLLLVLVSVSFLVRQSGAAQLVVVFRWAYVALLGTLLVLEPGPLFQSLSGSVEYGLGLVRYQPLGMNPNLSGLVYGGGAMLFFQRVLAADKLLHKLFALTMSALCLSVLLAASARASMLALAIAGAVGITLIALRGSRRSRIALLLAAFIGVVVILVQWAAIKDYLLLILDVDSPTRGVDSGATGRTDIWRDGVALVFSNAMLLFTGRGIRSALPEVIGFPVESSYINLALEHGLVFGALIAGAFFVTAARALRQGLRPGQFRYQTFIAGLMIVFLLAQSIFNRYLIGVGNPYSLWILVLILQLNLGAIAAGSPTRSRRRAAAPPPLRRDSFPPLNPHPTTRSN